MIIIIFTFKGWILLQKVSFFLYATGEKKLEIVIKDNDGNDDNNKTYFFQAYVR